MKPPKGHRRGPRRPAPETFEEKAAELHRHAVKLFDKGDGRAVDWPMLAAALFTAGLSCLDEAKGTDRAAKVLRSFEAKVYDRIAGNPDDGTAYTSNPLPRPKAGPGPSPVLDHDLHR